MDYLGQRAEAASALTAKLEQLQQQLNAERREKRALEAEVARLQVGEVPKAAPAHLQRSSWAFHLSNSMCQAEQTRQQELRETLHSQQLALRAEHDAAMIREIGRTSSAYGVLRKAEKDLVCATAASGIVA